MAGESLPLPVRREGWTEFSLSPSGERAGERGFVGNERVVANSL
jgi:hypothetical protein